MRVKWDDVFETNDGAISPKVTVSIEGVQITPIVSFGDGVSFSGVDLAKHVGKDLDVEQDEDTGVVTINDFIKVRLGLNR